MLEMIHIGQRKKNRANVIGVLLQNFSVAGSESVSFCALFKLSWRDAMNSLHVGNMSTHVALHRRSEHVLYGMGHVDGTLKDRKQGFSISKLTSSSTNLGSLPHCI